MAAASDVRGESRLHNMVFAPPMGRTDIMKPSAVSVWHRLMILMPERRTSEGDNRKPALTMEELGNLYPSSCLTVGDTGVPSSAGISTWPGPAPTLSTADRDVRGSSEWHSQPLAGLPWICAFACGGLAVGEYPGADPWRREQGGDIETDEGSEVCAEELLLWVSFTPACSTRASLSF
ncbi:unnamed protein product [Pleuronectes platessa]|uniref:Uncharacterized protein n=1 Tax=Pleuronectes platessa TaxID=8262 RepID=A0A9N7V2Z2_PLEPL|nr:unnamed protein product [Pleuronectes platessa]